MNTKPAPTDAVLAWFDRNRVRLWLVIVVLLLLGFNGQWRIGPDSAIHVTVARSLAQGQGFTHPTHLDRIIQPGLAYLTAATFRVFGVDRFLAIDALMLLTAAGVLCLTYQVVRLRFDRPTAVLIVCMLAVNETFYRYGYQVLTDMPFLLGLAGLLLGIECCCMGSQKWRAGILLIPASLLVMAAFRSVVITVLIAGAVTAVIELLRGRHVKQYGIVLSVLVLLAGVFIFRGGSAAYMRDGGRAMELIEGSGNGILTRVFANNGPALVSEHVPESVFGIDFGPWIGVPLGLVLIISGVALYRVRPFWGVLVAVFIVQWLVLITTERYMLVVMPLLAIGWWRIGLWLERRYKPGLVRGLLIALLVLWFAPNLVRIGAFVVEQRATPFLASYQAGRYQALQAVAAELIKISEPGDVILADQAPQLTWYTRMPVYGPDTLTTFGEQRDDTIKQLQDARRILLISPVNDQLNDKIGQLKLTQAEALKIVPTPGFDDVDEYKIIRMHMRTPDWDNYRKRMERRLQRARDAEQGDGQTEQAPGQTEQPGDQPR